ncbi:heme exporter protein CcmB [uncultured Sphingomonas sp.]|uniref:heme exporter protein CcmB n=1 Tax=uncultured Sphingomonas sp. TaxID=158754 RepID=UPI0025D59FA6|nr:heme exporter protein CcmB [uncultured Sphingomonas sp.]
MIALLCRDLRHAYGAGAVLPVLFFLLVATLFPFAVGSDHLLLGRIGGGVLWTAALLAALLPIERLIAPDLASGMLDQLGVRGWSMEAVSAIRLLSHWLGFGPLLMAAALPAAALLDLDGAALLRVEAGLLLGTPGLAALALTTACLTVSLRGAGALAGIVMLPLSVPLLIFGASSGAGALKLLSATSLLYVAAAPFVAAAALRAVREGQA